MSIAMRRSAVPPDGSKVMSGYTVCLSEGMTLRACSLATLLMIGTDMSSKTFEISFVSSVTV
jgi:hypothetical protein